MEGEMPIYSENCVLEKRYLTLEDLSRCNLPHFAGTGGSGSKTLRISRYIRDVFESYRDQTGFGQLYLPPPRHLYGFLDCTEDDLKAALSDLCDRGYGYTMHGTDYPLEIHDDIALALGETKHMSRSLSALKRLFAG
jgi:hypothetical protein